jgi:hypothetical protein
MEQLAPLLPPPPLRRAGPGEVLPPPRLDFALDLADVRRKSSI